MQSASNTLKNNLAHYPHLTGRISTNKTVTIRGSWCIDSANCTPQEFELIKLPSTESHPENELKELNGVYHGSFSTEWQDCGTTIRESVAERCVELRFIPETTSTEFRVVGSGKNRYGSFQLFGEAKRSNGRWSLDMHKVYEFMTGYDELRVRGDEVKREVDDSALAGVKIEQPSNIHIHNNINNSNDRQMTRVDGKGLWRSWKRNFNSQLTAILDLVDNSLDASITNHTSFIGHCHINTDTYKDSSMPKRSTTGLVIVNNCIQSLPPLQKCLEVYDSSKVDSGADHVGENGVGLKQACATLSDCCFVLVKNGGGERCELGIVAERLQSTEGVYLPAFQFSHNNLANQMKRLFSQPKYTDVAQTIAEYGAPHQDSPPSLEIGIRRLCSHFDNLCTADFRDSPYVFAVVVDKVRSDNVNAMTSIRVNELLDELTVKISQTYLHVPRSFDFRIKSRRIDYTFWQRRLVEFTKFTIKINSTIPYDEPREDPHKHTFRIYTGFDSQSMIDPTGSRYGALFVYSRRSGRLITYHNDARTLLSLSAGGTEFCSGLRVIIDDFEGHLPLNPTKQDVAFSELANGEIFRENLWKSVGAVAHMYYKFHINKFGGQKKVLSRKITEFGEQMATEAKLDAALVDLDLSTFKHSKFRSIRGNLRVDVEKEVVGKDTIYRIAQSKHKPVSKRASPKKKSRDNFEAEVEYVPRRQPPRKKRKPQPPPESSDSDPEFDDEEVEKSPEMDLGEEDGYLSSGKEENVDEDDDKAAATTYPPNAEQPLSLPVKREKPHLYHKEPSANKSSSQQAQSATSTRVTKRASSAPADFGGLFPEDDSDEDVSLKDELAMKNELIKDLTLKFEERYKTLMDRDKLISVLRSENDELTDKLAEKDKEISKLKEQLRNEHMMCAEL